MSRRRRGGVRPARHADRDASRAASSGAPGRAAPHAAPVKLQFNSAAEQAFSWCLLGLFVPAALTLIVWDMRNGTQEAVGWIIPLGIPIALLRALFEEYRIYDPATGELFFVRRLFFIGRRKLEARRGEILGLELSVWPAATAEDPLRRMTAPFFLFADGRRLRAGNDQVDGRWTREDFVDTATRLGLRWTTFEGRGPDIPATPPDARERPGPDGGEARAEPPSATPADGAEPLVLPIDRAAPVAMVLRWLAVAVFVGAFWVGLAMQRARGGGYYGDAGQDLPLVFMFIAGMIRVAAEMMRETVAFDFFRGRIVRLPSAGDISFRIDAGATADAVAVGLAPQWSMAWKGTRYWSLHLLFRDGSTFMLSTSTTDHDALELYGKKLARRLGVPLVDGRRALRKLSIWNSLGYTDHPLAIERAGGSPRYIPLEGYFQTLLHGHLLPGLARPGFDLIMWSIYGYLLTLFAVVRLTRP